MVYDIKNVSVTPKAGGRSFMIKANEGFYIHLPEHTEFDYKPLVVLLAEYNFANVQVVPESEVPVEAFGEFYVKEVNNG